MTDERYTPTPPPPETDQVAKLATGRGYRGNVREIPLASGPLFLGQADGSPEHDVKLAEAIRAVQEYDAVAEKAFANEDFSPVGRTKRLQPEVAKASLEVLRAYRSLEDEDRMARHDEGALYAVRPIEATAAADAVLDGQARAWIMGLKGDERVAAMRDLIGGRLPHVAKALARSPIPTGIAPDIVRMAWRRAVDAEHPDESAKVAAKRKGLDAQRFALKRVAGALTKSKGFTRDALKASMDARGTKRDNYGPFADFLG
jgi:hypothetical protein